MTKITIDNLATTIIKGLEDYKKLATNELKTAVKESANLVKDEIKLNAPKDKGKYQKSWSVKKDRETSNSLKLVVHSKNRYQLAHLLERGHAKRNGGRVSGKVHIEPAEQKGIKEFEQKIKKALEG